MPDAEERRPRKPRERLRSLKDPVSSRQPRRQQQRRDRQTTETVNQPRCPGCDNPQFESDGDNLFCVSCGTVIEDSAITAEVTFGESAAGAAVVQGGFVGADQRFSRTMGTAFKRVNGVNGREVTEAQGRDEITKQGFALSVNESLRERAFLFYKLAVRHNFIQGRRIRVVAAVCLYLASRQSGQSLLLLDLAEIIHVSVYFLGDTYTAFKRHCFIDDEKGQDAGEAGRIRPVEVHRYIDRFAKRLDFGKKHRQVCEDALSLLKRMDRDWIVSGRTPAGLCGACIILAARMNNFRRTVREVVYVVRVCDITIAKRLEEFKQTRSSDLSIDKFREWNDRIPDTAEPPSVYEARRREERLKRKLDRMLTDDSDETDRAGSRARTQSSQLETANHDGGDEEIPRYDADGFAIPNVPRSQSAVRTEADPSENAEEPPKKRGRPKREPPPVITEEELLAEEQLSKEVEEALESDFWETQEMQDALAKCGNRWSAYSKLEQARLAALPRQVPGWNNEARIASVSSAVEIGEDEFADDPEVQNCLLSEAEMKIKERIWVTHNEDWLRQQQAKVLKKTLDEAGGKTNANRNAKKGRKKNKDTPEAEDEEGESRPQSAAEATARMNAKKGRKAYGYSSAINYAQLDKLWKQFDKSSDRSESGVESQAASAAASRAGSAVPSRADSVAPSEAPSESMVTDREDTAAMLPTPEPTQQSRGEKSREDHDENNEQDDAQAPGEGAAEGGEDGEADYEDEEEEEEEDDDEARGALQSIGVDQDDYYEDEEDVGFGDEEDY